MMSGDLSGQASVLDWYTSETGVLDEMWNGETVHPHWNYFIQSLQTLGFDEMERRRQEANRLLRENGVTYNIYSDPQGFQRIWDLDPVPMLIDSTQWAGIETGLTERAELLNLILTDLYGPRELIKLGLLPIELVYNHAGFLRACDHVQAAIPHQLIFYAADLARGPLGDMYVLGDRTQAPSGAGYALENRTVTSRIVPSLFRDCHVHRLSGFFNSLRRSLTSIALTNKDNPRVVVLTPGPFNETYFEHAYLAAYLGFNLVHGDSLIVRDGKVWMKAIGGLQQVDVILRRVDDYFCDPVELLSDSRLGVPGLLDAARRGNVVIANPLGSSVLENPGILAFLPAIAKHYLGHDLKIPSVRTWWCGQASDCKYVLENLENLLVKPINRQYRSQSVFGFELGKQELEQWRSRIKAKPYLYVGQEFVPFSTTPALVQGQLEARHAVLRSFLVSCDKDYNVMPGGLTRTAIHPGNYRVSNQAGCVSKDTWVLATEPEKQQSLWQQGTGTEKARVTGELPSSAADNLFWMGRYVERAEGTTRLLRTVLHRYAENDEFNTRANRECLNIFLRALTNLTRTYPGFIGENADILLANPQQHLYEITMNRDMVGGLANTLSSFERSAFAVRDRLSNDLWRVVDNLDVGLETETSPSTSGYLGDLQDKLDSLLTKLSAFSGLVMESMTREYGWYFMIIGRRLERAIMLANLLGSTCVNDHDAEVEPLMLEDLLLTLENLMTYRRRYRYEFQRPLVLQHLLTKEDNPRSLAYQLTELQEYISLLPREQMDGQLSSEERHVLETNTRLHIANMSDLLQHSEQGTSYPALDLFLREVITSMSNTSDAITEHFFSQGDSQQILGQSLKGSVS